MFGRPETGWAIYAPLAAQEVGVDCAPDAQGFAEALASWQGEHQLPATGIMDEATLRALDRTWQGRRPFVAASAHGACPAPPTMLANARTDEGYGGKQIQLRAGALDAYRRMVAAARAAAPVLAADRRMLTIFSGYRDPAADAARCAKEQNCNAVVRATCSAHRTGLAMDLFLGAAPGFPPDSSADPNRLYQSRSNAYLWMVTHAREYRLRQLPVRAMALGVDRRSPVTMTPITIATAITSEESMRLRLKPPWSNGLVRVSPSVAPSGRVST